MTENTEKRNEAPTLRPKRIRSAYIGAKEVRGQAPGTTRNGDAPRVRSTTARPHVMKGRPRE